METSSKLLQEVVYTGKTYNIWEAHQILHIYAACQWRFSINKNILECDLDYTSGSLRVVRDQ
jgi:hypothetical protein